MPYLGFLEYPGPDCHWRSEVGRRLRRDSVLDPVCFARPTMAQSASCRSWSGSCLLRFRTPPLDSPEPLASPRPSATVEQTCQTLSAISVRVQYMSVEAWVELTVSHRKSYR